MYVGDFSSFESANLQLFIDPTVVFVWVIEEPKRIPREKALYVLSKYVHSLGFVCVGSQKLFS